MAADFSRVRNNPLLDYAGVELKQGGVLLDADANELVAILDRRLRALAGDVLGRATVGANTPEAFHVTAVAGVLRIGRGRLYVDGLLAENHRAASDNQPSIFDALMAEPSFDGVVPYTAQPFLPNAPALPTSGRHLVYLDVWQREVTHLEDPALVESAVGVETSSRLQTVWQVRVLGDEAPAGVNCTSNDGDIPGWANVIASSTGRLSTGTYEESSVTDPCELPPTGGYRGLENQLYRVEVHTGGQPGAGATFKWSRDNASVGSRVKSIVSSTELELDSLGRDDVLRFNTDDWVEIIDDAREFSQAAGEMRRIVVDEANQRIRFTTALPTALLQEPDGDPVDLRRTNLRVRRWDHKGIVKRTTGAGNTAQHQDLSAAGSTGAINMPAAGTTLLLENGITVNFSSAGTKGFKSGDHWVFAARTGDASVELLQNAPPRGVHHHYARLGLWTVAANTVDDCRHPWPPSGGGDCACTQCVTPESHASGQLTIQTAVDRVRATGGTICLQAGQYALTEPVRVAGARSLRIKGQGAATVVATPGGAFAVEGSTAIAIESLSVVSLGQQSAITARTVAGLALHNLALAVLGSNDARGAAVALTGAIAGLTIRDNLIVAPEGIRAGEPPAEAPPTTNQPPPQFLFTAALRIEDNILWCERRAVTLVGTVGHMFASHICDNEVLGCREAAISALGFALAGASMRICDNSFNVAGPGIRCSVDGAWIEGNKITAVRQGQRQPTGSGIHLSVGLDPNGSDQCQVLANQISGFPAAGVLVDAPTQELIVKLNIIENCGNGIVMLDAASAGAVSIENNHLRNIGSASAEPPLGPFIVGVGIRRAEAATVAGNTVRKIGQQAAPAIGVVAGIATANVQRARVQGNEVTEVAPAGESVGAILAGIVLMGPQAQSEVSHNHVERDAQFSDQTTRTSWQAVLIDEPGLGQGVARMGDYTAVRMNDVQTLVVHGKRAYVHAAAAGTDAAGAATLVRGSNASVLGNVLVARSGTPAVRVVASGDLLFAQNRCELRGSNVAAVQLATQAAIINANRVQNRGDNTSIEVVNANAQVAAIGNITSGPIRVGTAPLPAPWAPLNINA
jgi:hypothetical protein